MGSGSSEPRARSVRERWVERGPAITPPFRWACLALLCALLLRPALSSLLGHRLSPLSLVGSAWVSPGWQRRCPLAPWPARRRPRFFRLTPRSGIHSIESVGDAGGPIQKRGGAMFWRHPRTGQAALSASFRPSLTSSRHPLRFSSPFVPPWNWQLSCLPTLVGHNRWAERTTLIRDVDYG